METPKYKEISAPKILFLKDGVNKGKSSMEIQDDAEKEKERRAFARLLSDIHLAKTRVEIHCGFSNNKQSKENDRHIDMVSMGKLNLHENKELVSVLGRVLEVFSRVLESDSCKISEELSHELSTVATQLLEASDDQEDIHFSAYLRTIATVLAILSRMLG